jgi:hypothetical protein
MFSIRLSRLPRLFLPLAMSYAYFVWNPTFQHWHCVRFAHEQSFDVDVEYVPVVVRNIEECVHRDALESFRTKNDELHVRMNSLKEAASRFNPRFTECLIGSWSDLEHHDSILIQIDQAVTDVKEAVTREVATGTAMFQALATFTEQCPQLLLSGHDLVKRNLAKVDEYENRLQAIIRIALLHVASLDY